MPKYAFPMSSEWIRNALADTPVGRSFFQIAADFYLASLEAFEEDGFDSPEAKRAAGAYGAMIRKWRSSLKGIITQDIVRAMQRDPVEGDSEFAEHLSRERVRAIQQDIFGQGQGSRRLHLFAIRKNNGCGRPAPLRELPVRLKTEARAFYEAHENDLKTAVESFFRR